VRRVAFVSIFAVLALVPSVRASPRIAGCPVFPANNPWNQRVDQLPVAKHSGQMVANIGLNAPVMPDFGSAVYNGEVAIGDPITVVVNRTRWVHVHFRWPSQSNRGLYPLPSHVAIQGGPDATGDRHVIVVDRQNCRDYELWRAFPHDGGAWWSAGAGAVFDLRSNHLRPRGWTSADAAGLSMLAGLPRYSEVKGGAIDHALRFSAPCTARRYVYPARHWANSCRGRWLPPMGARLRLKASVNISGLPYQARVIAVALKRYGLILADNGGPWEIQGAPNPRWNDKALLTLERLKGRDFEVANTSSLPHPGA
jgi:hypothetical protein